MNDKPEENGQPLPSLLVGWDEEKKTVHLGFQINEFPNWDFILMVLEGAKNAALMQRSLATMHGIQEQQRQALEHQAIMKKLRG